MATTNKNLGLPPTKYAKKRSRFWYDLPRLWDVATPELKIIQWPKQRDMIFDRAQMKIIKAGRQTGKSLSNALLLFFALLWAGYKKETLHCVLIGNEVADTRPEWNHFYDLAERYQLFDRFPDIWAKVYRLHPVGDNRKCQLSIKDKNGKVLVDIKTVPFKDSKGSGIRGKKEGFDIVIICECQSISNSDELIGAAIPTLRHDDRLNLVMITGTEPQYAQSIGNRFDHLFKDGEHPIYEHGECLIKSYEFKKSEVPSGILELKEPGTKDLEEAALSAAIYSREIDNKASVKSPLFPEFNLDRHVGHVPYQEVLPYAIGIDTGYNKPAVIFLQYINGQVRVFAEISGKDKIIDELIPDINLSVESICHSQMPISFGVDKAGNSQTGQCSDTQFAKIKAVYPMASFTTNAELINKANQTIALKKLFLQNKIIIDSRCTSLIRSISIAQPDISQNATTFSRRQLAWKKINGVDDPLDALMYALINNSLTQVLIAQENRMNINEAIQLSKRLGLT